MKLGTYTKQPRERQSYTIYYGDAMDAGDNIKTAALLAVAPLGLVVDQITIINNGSRVKFWAASGTAGVTYKATFTVVTEDGRTFEDEVIFKVKEV